MGVLIPKRRLPRRARRRCASKHGALLIFDEVMTGFRLARGGAQERYGVKPDLTTLGKVIGGGMPLGAYGGRRDIMAKIAPEGPVYQAGTLSGNPLAVAAGLACLKELAAAGHLLAARGDRARARGRACAPRPKAAGVPRHAQPRGQHVHRSSSPASPCTTTRSAKKADTARFGKFFHAHAG